MRRLKLISAALCLAFVACSDDADFAESYRYDLADLTTAADGQALLLSLDDGTTLIPSAPFSTSYRDTTVRVLALFVPQAGGADLRRVTDVLTAAPQVVDESDVRTDAVKVFSVWRGGRYVNFHLGLPTGGSAPHHLGFIDRGITLGDSGSRILHLQLYHYQNTDASYFTRETYASCLIDAYADCLGAGDSIAVSCATAAGAFVTTLPY